MVSDPCQQPAGDLSLAQRLRSRKFIGQEAVNAIHGRKLPFHLGRPLVQYCIVRGIRHHLDFAKGEANALKGLLPMFTKAINARLIMSNEIPDMQTTEDMPYCIWHPEIPSEETLRQLADRYPDFQYQVGRACAIAGYTELYESLKILPEVSIAEEARSCGNLAIFASIMKHMVKWKVFDDYTGTILAPTPSHINADTMVYDRLQFKQGFKQPVGRIEGEEGDSEPDDEPDWDSPNSLFCDYFLEGPYGYNEHHNNVTGDMGLDAPDTWAQMPGFRLSVPPVPSLPVSQTVLDLLCSPLPADLPSCDKNLLIVMAAYRGDVDRYCRLRRPYMVLDECDAIIRGIYHNSQFAKWWSTQPSPGDATGAKISSAICARFIMNDDISYAIKQANDDLPEGWSTYPPDMIFYPDIASTYTYEALARAIPAMRMPVARAAIYANYRDVFDLVMTELKDNDFCPVKLDYTLYVQALASPEPYYRDTLERLAEEQGVLDVLKTRSPSLPPWTQMSLRQARMDDRSTVLYDEVFAWRNIRTSGGQYDRTALYDGVQCDALQLERYFSLPIEWRPGKKDVDESTRERNLDYKSWPPNSDELLKTKRSLARR